MNKFYMGYLDRPATNLSNILFKTLMSEPNDEESSKIQLFDKNG